MDAVDTAIADFDQAELFPVLDSLSTADLNALDFGVIGFDAAGMIRVFNVFESRAAGLPRERVLGRALFTNMAPCMNNFMVAQRFEDAAAAGAPLDATLDYVLTVRTRPTAVTLRLLAQPGRRLRYLLIQRR